MVIPSIAVHKSQVLTSESWLAGFVSMCVQHIPSPLANARNKVETVYTGPTDTELADAMFECDTDVSGKVGVYYRDSLKS